MILASAFISATHVPGLLVGKRPLTLSMFSLNERWRRNRDLKMLGTGKDS